jgi:hypothetical protein
MVFTCVRCGVEFRSNPASKRRFCSVICYHPNPVPSATHTPTPEEVSWAAGVYEGEGCVTATKKNGIFVTVTQKDKWLLERFVELFGGRFYYYPQHRRAGYWARYGVSGRDFLMTIYPWLSPRRKTQIDRALAKRDAMPLFKPWGTRNAA